MKTNTITTEQVWQDFKDGLKGFILSKVKNEDVADDILQETFIKVHLNLRSLKDETRLKSWIYQITRNTIQDAFRKQQFSLDVKRVDVPDENDSKDLEKFQSCMMPFINKLPEKYREALVLSDLNRIGQTDLARQLNISYSGAKSRVQRARQLLHSYLTECCDITADKYGNIVSHIPKGRCLCAAA
jgi:RNA polymerase sigma-70 factor (ECF subfamily)